MGERVESVGSRLSQLAKSGFAKKSGYGQYVAHSYKVDKFLDELESGTVEIEVSDKKQPGKKKLRGLPLAENKEYLLWVLALTYKDL